MNIFFIYSLLFPFIHSFFYASSIASFSASVYYNMRSDRNQFLSPDPSSPPPMVPTHDHSTSNKLNSRNIT